jgi:hypothetical protein
MRFRWSATRDYPRLVVPMNTQKISLMKLVEAELKNRVDEPQPELSKIDMIVRLSEVRSTIENLESSSGKKDQGIILPPEKNKFRAM